MSTQNLASDVAAFKKNRDLGIVAGILWYGLNIVDATVSAHLVSFDVSDDLTFHMSPSAPSNSIGLSMGLTFKPKSYNRSYQRNYTLPHWVKKRR